MPVARLIEAAKPLEAAKPIEAAKAIEAAMPLKVAQPVASVSATHVDIEQIKLEAQYIMECLQFYDKYPEHRDSLVAFAKLSAEAIVTIVS